MARLPVPGPQLSEAATGLELPAPPLPAAERDVLERLWAAGHAAYVVGGSLRDHLLGLSADDWDVATDALPERLLELLPDARYENRFGTVVASDVEVTTFRRDHRYGDHRRPDAVTFTDSLTEDLCRRDFTINAIGWGRSARSDPTDLGWVDPTSGLVDLRAGLIRAVGEPSARFDEDALRLVRAVRIAALLGFSIEDRTRDALEAHAADVRFVAQERIGREFARLMAIRPPSRGFRLLAESGLLLPLFPELAAQRGVAQDKVPGADLWDHCLATLDGAAELSPENARLHLAALLHDTGKPESFADGRFPGHDEAGARIARAFLGRLAWDGRTIGWVERLVRWHMFTYEASWSDAAVRRFMRRVGPDLVDDLLLLRAADNMGSGLPADAGRLAELRARVGQVRDEGAPLSLRDLAVNGDDLLHELDRAPGPWLGTLLDRMLESVIADPSRNTRERLLADAHSMMPGPEEA